MVARCLTDKEEMVVEEQLKKCNFIFTIFTLKIYTQHVYYTVHRHEVWYVVLTCTPGINK